MTGGGRYSATKAVIFSIIASCIPVFDVPVFWPILVMYFFILMFITLRRQIAHMRKYKCDCLPSSFLRRAMEPSRRGGCAAADPVYCVLARQRRTRH